MDKERGRRLAEQCFAVADSTNQEGEKQAAINRGMNLLEKHGLDPDDFDIPGRERSKPKVTSGFRGAADRRGHSHRSRHYYSPFRERGTTAGFTSSRPFFDTGGLNSAEMERIFREAMAAANRAQAQWYGFDPAAPEDDADVFYDRDGQPHHTPSQAAMASQESRRAEAGGHGDKYRYQDGRWWCQCGVILYGNSCTKCGPNPLKPEDFDG